MTMDSRTRTALVSSLSKKLRRRVCPSCRHGLADAAVEVDVGTATAMVGFVCSMCGFKSRSTVPLSDRLLRRQTPGPITELEVRTVREALATFYGTLTDLIAAAR